MGCIALTWFLKSRRAREKSVSTPTHVRRSSNVSNLSVSDNTGMYVDLSPQMDMYCYFDVGDSSTSGTSGTSLPTHLSVRNSLLTVSRSVSTHTFGHGDVTDGSIPPEGMNFFKRSSTALTYESENLRSSIISNSTTMRSKFRIPMDDLEID